MHHFISSFYADNADSQSLQYKNNNIHTCRAAAWGTFAIQYTYNPLCDCDFVCTRVCVCMCVGHHSCSPYSRCPHSSLYSSGGAPPPQTHGEEEGSPSTFLLTQPLTLPPSAIIHRRSQQQRASEAGRQAATHSQPPPPPQPPPHPPPPSAAAAVLCSLLPLQCVRVPLGAFNPDFLPTPPATSSAASSSVFVKPNKSQ